MRITLGEIREDLFKKGIRVIDGHRTSARIESDIICGTERVITITNCIDSTDNSQFDISPPERISYRYNKFKVVARYKVNGQELISAQVLPDGEIYG